MFFDYKQIIKTQVIMTICIITVLMGFAGASKAQNCLLEINQVDPVTNLVVKRTEDVAIGKLNGQALYFKAQCIGTKKYLKVRYYRYGNFALSDKLPMILVFQDGTSVDLIPRPLAAPNTGEQSNIVSVSSMLIFDISEQQYNTIIKNTIVSVSITTENGNSHHVDLRERYRQTIQTLLKCVDV